MNLLELREATPLANPGFSCCYCLQLITSTHDGQRVSKRQVVHSACAFAADEKGWALLDGLVNADDQEGAD